MSNYFDKLFTDNGKKIFVYISKESVTDPIYKTLEKTEVYCIPVIVLITQDLSPAQMQWKMPGIQALKGKELIINKNDLSTFEASSRIVIDDENYYGWRDNSGKKIVYDSSADNNYIEIRVWSK